MACGFYATLHGSIGIFIFPRAGNVDVSASPVVTYACVLFSIAHKAAGAADHPAFPAPSRVEDVVLQKLGQACRGNARSCPLGCLKFESENTRSSRTSEFCLRRAAPSSGERDPGPITTGLCYTKIVRHRCEPRRNSAVWVPAFAGTTADGKNATLRSGQSYSAAAANRLFSSSASSRACSARAFLMISSLM